MFDVGIRQAGYEPDHVKKTNQDRFLNYKDAGENKHLFGVFDGAVPSVL